MATEIRVPRLGWSMEEGGFVGWLKKHGDPVKAGDPLFTLEGDKATQDIEAIASGVLHVPSAAPTPGSPVAVGTLLGYLLAPGETFVAATAAAGPSDPASPVPTSRPNASTLSLPTSTAAVPDSGQSHGAGPRLRPGLRRGGPAAPPRAAISPRALRTAAELGVDWTTLRGSGRSGRIREKDVLDASQQRAPAQKRAAGLRPEGPTPRPAIPDLGPARDGTIVITDWTFSDLSVEEAILRPLGVNLVARQCGTEADLVSLVADADVVVTQFGRLNSRVIGAMRRVRGIVRYGIGVDNIDLEAARVRGIPVANVPDYCIDEVADQTLAFILALTRQVVPYHQEVSSGRWGLVLPLSSMDALARLAVGVIGFGRIGRAVVRRLAPFGCRVFVFDPMVPALDIEQYGAHPVSSLDELWPRCDVVTLHCPSTAQTRHLINATTLTKFKRGARLVNVARGDIVDTDALVAALQTGQLAAAALDVCQPEPIPAGHPILKLPNILLAPHVASVSEIAVRILRETVATLAAITLANGLPPNIVNGVTAPRPWAPPPARLAH